MFFFNADNFFQKSTDNGATWIELADGSLPPKGPGLNKQVTHLSAAGGRLYCGMNFGDGTGMPYYSTDGGDNWSPDTLGAPGTAGSYHVVSDIYAWGHWVYVKWDMPHPYYIKSFDGSFALNPKMDTGAYNARSVVAKGDTLFVCSSKLYYSVDGGATWITPANNGYTQAGTILADGNRLYVFAGYKCTLIYSDDNGENWTPIDITSISNRTTFNGLPYSRRNSVGCSTQWM